MKKIWDLLNGNKTIIFNTTAGLLQYAVANQLLADSSGIKWTIGVLFTLGGGSLIHHAKKGYFKRNKGQ